MKASKNRRQRKRISQDGSMISSTLMILTKQIQEIKVRSQSSLDMQSEEGDACFYQMSTEKEKES